MISFYKILFFCFAFFLLHFIGYTQGVSFIPGDSVAFNCINGCGSLTPNIDIVPSTTSYSVTSIAYTPLTLTGGTNITLSDDTFSSSIPIGFDFCFYGNLYSNCCIGSNGVLTFNTLYANANCNANTLQALPFSNSSFANTAIFFPFCDVDPGQGGTITYKTTGAWPNRKFIVQFTNMALFGGAACNVTNNNFYVILSEGSNTIEVHIGKKAICPAGAPANLSAATIGIQNNNATAFVTPLGKNAAQFNTLAEAWKFSPNGPSTTKIYWKELKSAGMLDTLSTNVSTFNLCINTSKKIIVEVVYDCPLVKVADTITIYKITINVSSLTLFVPCYDSKASATITASSPNGGLQYAISPGSFSASNVFNNLDTGKHFVTVKDASGCTTVGLVKVSPIYPIKIKPDSVISSSCTTSSGKIYLNTNLGTPPYTYSWYNPSLPTNNNVGINLGPGLYRVAVQDVNGCKDTIGVELLEILPKIAFDSIFSPKCALSTGYMRAKATGLYGPFTYKWNGNSLLTDSFLANLPPGNYVVQVKDALGCVSATNGIVLPWVLLGVTTKTEAPNCNIANGSVAAQINWAFAQAPITYNWLGLGTDSAFYNLGNNLYSVIVTDARNCSTVLSTVLNQIYATKVIAMVDTTTCGYANGAITLSGTLGKNPYKYFCDGVQLANAKASMLDSGFHMCIAIDTLNCPDTLNVYVKPSIGVIINSNSKNAFCNDSNGTIQLNNISMGDSIFINNKYKPPIINNLLSGVYSCTVKDSIGCIGKKLITVLEDGSPNLQVDNYIAPTCFGDSSGMVTLLGTGGNSPYKYSIDGNNFQTNATINNIASGIYNIFIKDANGCITDTTFVFNAKSKVLLSSLLSDTLVCYNDVRDNYTINATGGTGTLLYAIDSGAFSASNILNGISAGTHIIKVKDSLNCIFIDSFKLIAPKEPLSINFEITNIPCFEENKGAIEATIVGGWPPYNSLGINNSGLFLLNQQAQGLYSLVVQDNKGCSATKVDSIKQFFCCRIIVPNAVSPNGDGFNDNVKLIVPSNVQAMDFKVYNRWGSIVYASTNANEVWNVAQDGKYFDMDVYYYTLSYKCEIAKEWIYKKGEINIIK